MEATKAGMGLTNKIWEVEVEDGVDLVEDGEVAGKEYA